MKNKINATVTALFLVLIFGFGIAFWILPDVTFSPEENRTLQTFPTLSAEDWLDGKVSSRLTSYYSDQFPLRDLWLSLHAVSELAMGRGESNGVLVGENHQLAVRRFDAYLSLTQRLEDTDVYSPAHVQSGLDAVVSLQKSLAKQGIPLCVLLAPRTIDVTVGDFAYPADLTDRLDQAIQKTFADANVNSVELLAAFREMHENGSYVYYRTDHHWTTLGAYTAYAAVMEAWGMEQDTLPADFFKIRTIPSFYGTTYSRSGMLFIPPDTLEIWEAIDGSDARFTVTNEKNKTVIESGFISEKYLSEKDKYGAFLDGTHSLLFITDREAAARGESRPRLLLARDSFANSMVPFLARHFDICMVNLSGGMTNLSRLAEDYGCDRVLIVCNRENLVTADCLRNVK
ncbi:MAG: hypothetical protein E7610_04145 [Ruminococcaceae bacterium]|nr:hypothetical protein [Oscillospiraceae bacterium]